MSIGEIFGEIIIKKTQTRLVAIVLVILVIAGITFPKVFPTLHSYENTYNNALLEIGLPYKDIDICMKWAFGEEYRQLFIRDAYGTWNKRHGDLFSLSREDFNSSNFFESIEEIGKAYILQ